MPDNTNKWSVLLVISLAYFVAPMIGMSITVALPVMGRDLMIDAVLLAWIPTSFIMASAMSVVPTGRIADIYGRKRIFLWGTIISAVTSLLLGFSHTATTLILFRAIQGLGAAMIISTGLAIVSSAFPDQERGKAIGLCAAAVYSGQSFAPFIGGLLTQHLGWRSIFLINVPLCLIIIIFVFWKMKEEWVEAKGDRFDLPGSLIYGLTIFSIVYGFSTLPGTEAMVFIMAGAMGAVIFVLLERKITSPILDIHLFLRNRTFALSNLSNFIHYGAVYAIAFLMSLYLQYIKGLSPQNAGLLLVSQPLVQALFSPLAGRLADRYQPRIVSSLGMTLTALGILSLTFVSAETELSWILFGLMLVGFGVAFFVPPNTNAIMGSAGRKNYGIASGIAATLRQIGMMFSMAVAMLVFSLFMGRVEVTPEQYPVFLKCLKMLLTAFTLFCFLGIFTSLARGKVARQRDE